MPEAPRTKADSVRLGVFASLLAPLVAWALALPAFRLPYVWDDYTFLNDARNFTLGHLLPFKPLDPFYRPLSRDLYFSILRGLGSVGPLVGHVLNAGLLAAGLILLNRLVSRMLSLRAGLIASLILAALGVLPMLIGWVSGCQDVLAIFFVLLAMTFRVEGRDVPAFLAATGALFSKETSFVFLPAIALLPWVRGRRLSQVSRGLVGYALLGVAWASVHPGVRMLFARHFSATETDYVGGTKALPAMGHLARYVLTLLNLPQPGTSAPWPAGKLVALVLGLAAAAPAVRLAGGVTDEASTEEKWPEKRVLLLGVYMAAAPLLLTSAMVQGWSPYYSAFGGLGLALTASYFLRRLPVRILASVILVFLALGVWQRGQQFESGMTTERNFEETTNMLGTIEKGFFALEPTLPPDSRVVVSTQVRGVPGIYIHIYHLQALREWYGDPTIQIVRPEIRRTRRRPEFFFVIAGDGRVIELDPRNFRIRPPGAEVDYSSGERAVRTYALGLYASGEPRLAADLLLRMPQSDAGMEQSHRRLAAALLRAGGDSVLADSLVRNLRDLPRDYVLTNIAAFLAEPLPVPPVDRYVLNAFGISWDDRQALLWLARWYDRYGYARTGLRFIRRYLELTPRDASAKELMEHLKVTERRRRQYDLPSEDRPLQPT